MEAATELLSIVGMFLADPGVWTTHARAARRWRWSRTKTVWWEGASQPKESHAWRMRSCCPLDSRAAEWSAAGVLELAAEGQHGQDVVDALDLLRTAGRGWAIQRVEEEGGHAWMLWTVAAVVDLGRRRWSPRRAARLQVDLKTLEPRDEEATGGPTTMRSSQRTSRKHRRAA